MFSSSVNPTTGKLEWIAQERDVTSEEADISHELARSQYGDMLLDKSRNRLYYRALERAIAQLKASGREPHVLDIGTGTGLLAMMGARAGATKVTACEVLRPMVRIARQVITKNGFSDVIKIVPKRSTEMTEADMTSRANILVTEVFDTELIGEGALVTFAHAHKDLLEPGCIVIPSSSKMYVRLMESEFLWSSHKLMPDRIPTGNLKMPPSWGECAGPPSVWDLHVEEVKVPEQMRLQSASTEIASFQFDDASLSPEHTSSPVDIEVLESGVCHGLVVWWDIDLGGVTLTMDPWNYQQWRDHWLQAVHLWPRPLRLNKGERVKVALHHDNYSIWFSIKPEEQQSPLLPLVSAVERPLCTCGVHTACSRTRVSMYNDKQTHQVYLDAMAEVLVGKPTVVCVSDGCLLPLMLAQSRDKFPSLEKLFTVESSPHCCRMIKELLEANGLTNTVTVLEKPCLELTAGDFGGRRIDAVIGEPFFSSSLLPWHNVHYWYALTALKKHMSSDCVVLPNTASLMAIAVNFKDMYNLRAPVGTVEGFDISAFDKAVGKYTTTAEGIETEPHPLWEYPAYPRSEVIELLTFDLTTDVPEKAVLKNEGEIPLNDLNKPCHGVVLWMDYRLTDARTASGGLLKEPGNYTEKLEWSPSHKQAVYFLPPQFVRQSLINLNYSLSFSTDSGHLELAFTGVH